MASYVNDLWPNFFPGAGAGLPRVGSFQNGSDIYLFFRYGYEFWRYNTGDYIAAWKSADNGATWAEVDGAHRPECYWQCYECIQEGTLVRVVYNSGDVPEPPWERLGIITFDMATDTWGAVPVSFGPAIGIAFYGSTLAAARRSDNSLIIAYQDYGAAPDWDYRIRVVSWSVAGGWGASQTVITSAVNNVYLLDAVLGPSDRLHIFGLLYDVLDVYHRSVSSADVLGTQQTILAPVSGYSFSLRALVSAAGKIYLPYVPPTEDQLRTTYADSEEDPTWGNELITPNMPCIILNGNSVGMQLIAGAPHVFWVKAEGGHPGHPDGLYYNRRNASWGSDTLIEQDGDMPMPGLVAPSGAYLFWWNGATPEGWYYDTLALTGARYRVLP